MAEPRLVIVRRGQFATFELLTRAFGNDLTVQIIWDRRVGERRKAVRGPTSGERRQNDRRRIPPSQWGQMNYLIAGDPSH